MTGGPESERGPERPRLWRGRHLLYLAGVGLMFVGFRGIAHNTNDWEHPTYYAKLFIGLVIVHDLLWAAGVAVVAVLTRRFVPLPARKWVQLGLAASAVLLVLFYPQLRRYGHERTNTSVDPLNYAHGLLIGLGVVWALAGGALLADVLLTRRRARTGTGTDTSTSTRAGTGTDTDTDTRARTGP